MSPSDSSTDDDPSRFDNPFEAFSQQLNATVETINQTARIQQDFMESFADSMGTAEGMEELDVNTDLFKQQIQAYTDACETWFETAERMMDSTGGRDLSAEQNLETMKEMRDEWLGALNESYKEIMSTTAFAAVNAHGIENMLDLKNQFNRLNNEVLHELGFATSDDLDEVAERLVELERRQHAIEKKLDRLLEEMSSSS